MSDTFTVAFIIGIIMVITVAVISVLAHRADSRHDFDERQALLRGRGHQFAWYGAAVMTVVLIFLEQMSLIPTLSISAALILIMLVSMAIFMDYCIMNDALFSKGNSRKKYIPLCIGNIALYAAIIIGLANSGNQSADGYFIITLVISLLALFVNILIFIGIKSVMDSKEAAHEES